MYRFHVCLSVQLEVEAEDKAEAWEVGKEWAFIVQEGDGCALQRMALSEVVRANATANNVTQLYEVESPRLVYAGK